MTTDDGIASALDRRAKECALTSAVSVAIDRMIEGHHEWAPVNAALEAVQAELDRLRAARDAGLELAHALRAQDEMAGCPAEIVALAAHAVRMAREKHEAALDAALVDEVRP